MIWGSIQKPDDKDKTCFKWKEGDLAENCPEPEVQSLWQERSFGKRWLEKHQKGKAKAQPSKARGMWNGWRQRQKES